MQYKIFLLAALSLMVSAAGAAWWPFGGDDEEKKKEVPRLSELMEPASLAIDEATDLAADGKPDAAVEQYRKALEILDRIEMENPDRAATPEFASLRNKRAYITAAIDSILLTQARENAKAVAITDTSELEKRFAELRKSKQSVAMPELEEVHVDHWGNVVTNTPSGGTPKKNKVSPKDRRVMLNAVAEDLQQGNYEEADAILDDILKMNPADVSALNLKAAVKMQQGNYKEAQKALDAAMHSNPKDYNAYYNTVQIILETGGNRAAAKRYYDIGRRVGGPKDAALEEALAK